MRSKKKRSSLKLSVQFKAQSLDVTHRTYPFCDQTSCPSCKGKPKSKIHGPEPFVTVPYASCVSPVKDWSAVRWKSMWIKRKDCLRMKESVGWTSSRLTIRLLNLKRPQLNRVVQVLTGHCNLQRHKKTTCRAESSLCPNVA